MWEAAIRSAAGIRPFNWTDRKATFPTADAIFAEHNRRLNLAARVFKATAPAVWKEVLRPDQPIKVASFLASISYLHQHRPGYVADAY